MNPNPNFGPGPPCLQRHGREFHICPIGISHHKRAWTGQTCVSWLHHTDDTKCVVGAQSEVLRPCQLDFCVAEVPVYGGKSFTASPNQVSVAILSTRRD
jgi:hypothetical protein